MNFNEDQISAIIGGKELEIIALRMAANQMKARIDELEAKYEPKAKPELKAVEG